MKTSKLNKTVIAMALVMFAGGTLANGLPTGGVFTASGNDKLTIKGNLKKTNSCAVNINKGGVFDVGTIEIKDKLDEAGGVFASKNFRAIVKCDYPSAVVLSMDSSRSIPVTYERNFSKTFSPAGNKVYNTRVILDQGSTVTSPTQVASLNVGTMSGSGSASVLSTSVASLDSHSGAAKTYLSSNSSFKKYLAFREGANFSMHKRYNLPFQVQLKSRPFSEWINDMPSGKLSLNEQITIKSYII